MPASPGETREESPEGRGGEEGRTGSPGGILGRNVLTTVGPPARLTARHAILLRNRPPSCNPQIDQSEREFPTTWRGLNQAHKWAMSRISTTLPFAGLSAPRRVCPLSGQRPSRLPSEASAPDNAYLFNPLPPPSRGAAGLQKMMPFLTSEKVSWDTFRRYGGGIVQGWYKHGTSVLPKSVPFLCTHSPFFAKRHHIKFAHIPVSFLYENIVRIPVVNLARNAPPSPRSDRSNWFRCFSPRPGLSGLRLCHNRRGSREGGAYLWHRNQRRRARSANCSRAPRTNQYWH